MLEFNSLRIPEFEKTNQHLKGITGWTIFAVPGLIPNLEFFHHMAEKEFSASTWLRTMDALDYLEEPDMFHDVFGHVPLLCDPTICFYLRELARIALEYIYNDRVIEAIARLYWYTIEFGLVKEKGELKIYGAGILSSIAETEYCLSYKPEKVSFDLERILQTPYIKDSLQKQYFVLESMDQLIYIPLALENYFREKEN